MRCSVPPVPACAALLALLGAAWSPASAATAPSFDDAFWKHWGDGQAEVASYTLIYPRYGAPRAGSAVAIFVTETFSLRERVKSESERCCADHEAPVIKLNLVRDFPTGIYDYNLMTSAFVLLQARGEARAGDPTKVSFSSQEWCGHVYHHVLFDDDRVRSTSHSYFEGEADRQESLPRPEGGVSEDALWLWARGLSGPVLRPGEEARVPVLVSLARVRLQHVPLQWAHATLRRAAAPESIEVPGGTFESDVLSATFDDRAITFWVDRAAPRRIVRWVTSEGERAELVAVERLAYWRMNDPSGVGQLKRIGLEPRPPRTP